MTKEVMKSMIIMSNQIQNINIEKEMIETKHEIFDVRK
jgi:hypothetical protein